MPNGFIMPGDDLLDQGLDTDFGMPNYLKLLQPGQEPGVSEPPVWSPTSPTAPTTFEEMSPYLLRKPFLGEGGYSLFGRQESMLPAGELALPTIAPAAPGTAESAVIEPEVVPLGPGQSLYTGETGMFREGGIYAPETFAAPEEELVVTEAERAEPFALPLDEAAPGGEFGVTSSDELADLVNQTYQNLLAGENPAFEQNRRMAMTQLGNMDKSIRAQAERAAASMGLRPGDIKYKELMDRAEQTISSQGSSVMAQLSAQNLQTQQQAMAQAGQFATAQQRLGFDYEKFSYSKMKDDRAYRENVRRWDKNWVPRECPALGQKLGGKQPALWRRTG
jgi:hypothetical protein